jgi:hypothetical protein
MINQDLAQTQIPWKIHNPIHSLSKSVPLRKIKSSISGTFINKTSQKQILPNPQKKKVKKASLRKRQLFQQKMKFSSRMKMHQDRQVKGFAKNLKLLLWKIMAEENFHYKSHKTKSKGKYCLK